MIPAILLLLRPLTVTSALTLTSGGPLARERLPLKRMSQIRSGWRGIMPRLTSPAIAV
jgi:hypothetical protein